MTDALKTLNARTLPEEEYFYGHKACPGCGGSLAVRIALKVLGGQKKRCCGSGRMYVCGRV